MKIFNDLKPGDTLYWYTRDAIVRGIVIKTERLPANMKNEILVITCLNSIGTKVSFFIYPQDQHSSTYIGSAMIISTTVDNIIKHLNENF